MSRQLKTKFKILFLFQILNRTRYTTEGRVHTLLNRNKYATLASYSQNSTMS